jgi:hypothetical protein
MGEDKCWNQQRNSKGDRRNNNQTSFCPKTIQMQECEARKERERFKRKPTREQRDNGLDKTPYIGAHSSHEPQKDRCQTLNSMPYLPYFPHIRRGKQAKLRYGAACSANATRSNSAATFIGTLQRKVFRGFVGFEWWCCRVRARW